MGAGGQVAVRLSQRRERPMESSRWRRTPIRSGFAGPAVADGRVFVLDYMETPGSRTMDGAERLVCLDEETGETLGTHEWRTTYRILMSTYAIGPRATPTVDGDRVYVVGADHRHARQERTLPVLHAVLGGVDDDAVQRGPAGRLGRLEARREKPVSRRERWTPEFGQLAKVGSRPRRRSLECHGSDGVILLS